MRRLLATAAAAMLAAALVVLAAPAQARAADLTGTGETAVDDLRTCLASNDTLNVYYLIDNSGSLRIEDDGITPGSDPDKLRADILGNSLAQLGGLEDTTVNWAAGFFSTEFAPAISWRPWSPESAGQLETSIRDRSPSGYTNWLAAFHGVQEQLKDQPDDAGTACQMVVWFTDGAIDLPGSDRDTADALNDLCGQRIDPDGHEPTEGYGVLSALRQAGVVVMGTLLAQGETKERAEVMWPLVESVGTVDGASARCGQPSPPEGAVRGAVVDASDPDALARVFLELATRIGGGYPAPIAEDGTFWIDPGIARFRLVLGSGGWTLRAPAASGLAALGPDTPVWPVASVDASAGATQVEVRVADPSLEGAWRIDAAGVQDVFLYSDLTIEFDERNRIELTPDGQTTATLVAQVRSTDGTAAALDVFGTVAFDAWFVESGGSRTDLPGADIDRETGIITIPMPPDVSAAEVVVAASIDLVTAPNALRLAPITTEQRIQTVLPEDFPRIAQLPIELSALEGSSGRASGELIVVGPVSGGDGEVCVPKDPIVTSDAADRAQTWNWQRDDSLDADGCTSVPEGGEVRIGLTAANEQAADSTVQATVPVVLRSADGDELTQSAPIVFTSTHPVNVAAVGLLALLLILLGILLPLLALWLLNWRTTRLDIDTGVQRARFAVRIGPSGVAFADAPASDSALGARFDYRPPQRNVRSIDDPDLGRLAAHVPWFPLAEPTYRITPRQGTSIVGARTSARATSAGIRRDDGSMEFRQLPLDAFWAITVSDADLARTQRSDEVNGTAVLYHRMDPSQQDQYRTRLNDIALEGSLIDAVHRTRAGLAETQAKRNGKQSSKDAGAPSPTAASAPDVPGAPPRGTTQAPPARDGSVPSRDGAPPPRGGTTPPPRPGASGPPPLPGSPPPRPGSPPPRGR